MIADVTTFLQAIPARVLENASDLWLYTISCAAKEELWPELERIALARQDPMLAAVLVNRIDRSVASQPALVDAILNIENRPQATQKLLRVIVRGTGVAFEILQRALQWYTYQPMTRDITVSELDQALHCVVGIPLNKIWEETEDETTRLQWHQEYRVNAASNWNKNAGHAGSPRFTVLRLCEIMVAVISRDARYYCEAALVWDPDYEMDLSTEVELRLAELDTYQWDRLLARLTLGPGSVVVSGDLISQELAGVTAV